MKTILLAGGLGTRLREETEFRPKPMVEIGDKPVLWHIMKVFAHYGQKDFVICTGYKSEVIKNYFVNYEALNNDFTIQLGDRASLRYHDAHEEGDWQVTVAFTGDSTMTGGRVLRASRYFPGERFMCTFGDGLADVDIAALLAFHESHGRLATVTTVRPPSRFGVMDLAADRRVAHGIRTRWLLPVDGHLPRVHYAQRDVGKRNCAMEGLGPVTSENHTAASR